MTSTSVVREFPKRRRKKARRSARNVAYAPSAVDLLFPAGESDRQWGIGRLLEALAETQESTALHSYGIPAEVLRSFAMLSTHRMVETGRLPESEQGIADLLERRWGPQFRDPGATLSRLRSLPPVSLKKPALAKFLIANSRVPGMTPARWQQAQTFCILAETFLQELATYGESFAANEAERQEVQQALLDLLHPDSFNPQEIVAGTEQGWLSCNAHAGAFRLVRWARAVTEPGSMLRVGAGFASDETYVGVRDERGRAAGLMQLIRHLRQRQNVGGIAIDGQYGSGRYKAELLGRELRLAIGAPHTVYHSRCRSGFVVGRWLENNKVLIEMTEAPFPDAREPLPEWIDRWFAALCPWLERLATGDPSNIRCYSGIWSQLHRAPPAARLSVTGGDDR